MPPRRADQAKEFEGPNEEQWWRSDGESSGSDAGDTFESEAQQGLHDPAMDDRDAKWTEQARQGRVSDAILSW